MPDKEKDDPEMKEIGRETLKSWDTPRGERLRQVVCRHVW
jgi:hypothetical protein